LWKTRFLIKDRETLAVVQQCGASECWIDVSQGDDVRVEVATARPAVTPVETPGPAAKPVVRRAMADELQNATDIIKRSKAAVVALFAEARMGNAIDTSACGPLVNDIVESVDRNGDALISLCRLKIADEYTYMHSVSVCALMVSLGRQLGLDEATCRDAGMAGLLHDLGKASMPQEILNKPGKLTDEEFTIIKSHPVKGYETLLESGADNRRHDYGRRLEAQKRRHGEFVAVAGGRQIAARLQHLGLGRLDHRAELRHHPQPIGERIGRSCVFEGPVRGRGAVGARSGRAADKIVSRHGHDREHDHEESDGDGNQHRVIP
jgi:putative nucleotidyltransferase with HDIG domain